MAQSVASNKAFHPDDQHLERICTTSVPPPHTLASLKRCIVKSETLSNHATVHLFLEITSSEPMPDGPVALFGDDAPGSSSDKPIALVYSLPEQAPEPEPEPHAKQRSSSRPLTAPASIFSLYSSAKTSTISSRRTPTSLLDSTIPTNLKCNRKIRARQTSC